MTANSAPRMATASAFQTATALGEKRQRIDNDHRPHQIRVMRRQVQRNRPAQTVPHDYRPLQMVFANVRRNLIARLGQPWTLDRRDAGESAFDFTLGGKPASKITNSRRIQQ